MSSLVWFQTFANFQFFSIEADMADLEMIDRAVLPGDIVRKTGQTPLGTVLNVKTISKIRVLETSKFIGEIDCARLRKVCFYPGVLRFFYILSNRKRPIVRFSEEDRVEYKGWLGMIRELQEDRNVVC